MTNTEIIGVSTDEAAAAVSELAMLRYFPGDPGTRAAITALLVRMCSTSAQLDWLVRRTLELHNDWPGPIELRAVFCSKFQPKDGFEAWSEAFPDGVPSETESRRLLEPPPPRAKIQSADSEVNALVMSTANSRRMP